MIYRATAPTFPPVPETPPYAVIPAWYGPMTFTDTNIAPGIIYYYQVRANAGPATPPATGELLSAPTNTASATQSNRAPVAVNDSVSTMEDQAVTFPVLWNDTDPDGDHLTIASIAQPLHGAAVINPDQTVRYTPAPNYFGPDSFIYTVTDGRQGSATATVSLMLYPLNDLPVVTADSFTTAEDSTLTIPAPGVLVNDVDVDGDHLDAQLMGNPGHGSLTLIPDGSFSYTPPANFDGTDSFRYRASDGHGASGDVAVTITVTAVNDVPVAAGQSLTTAEDTVKSLTLTATDVDGGVLIYTVVRQPAHGWLAGPAPYLTYTPAANFNGTDSFTFTASDGTVVSNTATITLNVTRTSRCNGRLPTTPRSNRSKPRRTATPGPRGSRAVPAMVASRTSRSRRRAPAMCGFPARSLTTIRTTGWRNSRSTSNHRNCNRGRRPQERRPHDVGDGRDNVHDLECGVRRC